MSDQHNMEEKEPIRFTDKRRVDQESGQLRDQTTTDSDTTDEHADMLSQNEDIMNAAETEAETEAEEASGVDHETEALSVDLQRLQEEFLNFDSRVENDRDVAQDNAT